MSDYLPVYQSTCLPACLFACLSVSFSLCLYLFASISMMDNWATKCSKKVQIISFMYRKKHNKLLSCNFEFHGFTITSIMQLHLYLVTDMNWGKVGHGIVIDDSKTRKLKVTLINCFPYRQIQKISICFLFPLSSFRKTQDKTKIWFYAWSFT